MPICNKFYNPYNEDKLNLNRLQSANARHEKNYYGRVGSMDPEVLSDFNKTTAFSMTGGSAAFGIKD